MKVVSLSKEEKKTIKGGGWDTSNGCNATSGPFISWCHGCELEDK
ncbi:hypothetical protein [uncultured Flavobacterium sp.]